MDDDRLLRQLDELCDELAAEERATLVTKPVTESERGQELDRLLWSGAISRETWSYEMRRLERVVERIRMAERVLEGAERQAAIDAVVEDVEGHRVSQPASAGGTFWHPERRDKWFARYADLDFRNPVGFWQRRVGV